MRSALSYYIMNARKAITVSAQHIFMSCLDGLTSVTAIIALSLGMIYNIYSLDALSGIIGSVVITSWSFTLIKGSGKTLIEFQRK